MKLFYDTQQTPISEKLYKEGKTTNQIPSDDERVKNWFLPVPNGKERDYDSEGFPIFKDIEIVAPTEEEINNNNWAEYYKFCMEDISDYESKSGNIFSIKKHSLDSIKDKVETLSDDEKIIWFEEGSTFQTDKVELQEVYIYAERTKQTKLEEIFGV